MVALIVKHTFPQATLYFQGYNYNHNLNLNHHPHHHQHLINSNPCLFSIAISRATWASLSLWPCVSNIHTWICKEKKEAHMQWRVNINEGVAEEREMVTGIHTVKDISCIRCNTTLGWIYVSSVHTTMYTHTHTHTSCSPPLSSSSSFSRITRTTPCFFLPSYSPVSPPW